MTKQVTDIRGDLKAACSLADRRAAVRIAASALDQGVTLFELYSQVILPLMSEVGASWEAGQTAVWEEHMISSVMRSVVETAGLKTLEGVTVAPDARLTILACPPEEAHDLGMRMMADLFELAGERTVTLGADVPASELVAAARTLGAARILVSASTTWHKTALRTFIAEVESALNGPEADDAARVAILVTGESFDPAEYFGSRLTADRQGHDA